jgi:hypothetical protein
MYENKGENLNKKGKQQKCMNTKGEKQQRERNAATMYENKGETATRKENSQNV